MAVSMGIIWTMFVKATLLLSVPAWLSFYHLFQIKDFRYCNVTDRYMTSKYESRIYIE